MKIEGVGVEQYNQQTINPPPVQETTEATDQNSGAQSRIGEFSFQQSFFRFRVETADQTSQTSAQTNADASREAGTNAARRVQEAIRLGNRNPIEKLFSDRDASEELAAVLNDVKANESDANYQAAFLETLGPEGVTELESRLQDNNNYNSVMRNSLAVASRSGTLPADFQRQVVEKADLATLERLTSDPAHAMSDDFLVAAGRKVTTEGVGWKKFDQTHYIPGEGGAAPITFSGEEIQDHADQVLVNIARSSHTASLALLQDQNVVRGGLHMSFLSKPPDHDNGISELLKSGTALELRPQHDREINEALRQVSQVLSDPASFSLSLNVNGMTNLPMDKTVVTPNVANALAEVYRTNAPDFSQASGVRANDPRLFDNTDVRSFLGAALEHEQTRNTIYFTTQVEAARLMRADADFSSSVPGQSAVAGDLIGTYADAYSRTVLKEAADQDKQRALAAGLVNSAISSLGNAPVAPQWTIPAAFVANQAATLVNGALGGTNVDKAREQINDVRNSQQGSAELLVLTAYDSAARDALNNSPGTTPEGRQQAQVFRDALVSYNDALPSNEKILDGEGRLIERASANGEQLRNLYVLANGQVPPGLGAKRAQAQGAASIINRFIQPAINDVTNSIDRDRSN